MLACSGWKPGQRRIKRRVSKVRAAKMRCLVEFGIWKGCFRVGSLWHFILYSGKEVIQITRLRIILKSGVSDIMIW